MVQDLNQSRPDEVISKLSVKKELSPRERYYLASAQSQRGGVDVFSLYNILEIQLFHKNALEWKDLSKEKNPYLKFIKSQENVDSEKRRKKREERWEKYEPRIIAHQNLKTTKITFSEISELYQDYSPGPFTVTEEKYQKRMSGSQSWPKRCSRSIPPVLLTWLKNTMMRSMASFKKIITRVISSMVFITWLTIGVIKF